MTPGARTGINQFNLSALTNKFLDIPDLRNHCLYALTSRASDNLKNNKKEIKNWIMSVWCKKKKVDGIYFSMDVQYLLQETDIFNYLQTNLEINNTNFMKIRINDLKNTYK